MNWTTEIVKTCSFCRWLNEDVACKDVSPFTCPWHKKKKSNHVFGWDYKTPSFNKLCEETETRYQFYDGE